MSKAEYFEVYKFGNVIEYTGWRLNGKYHGEFRYYRVDGSVEYIKHYVNGVLNGSMQKFFLNGILWLDTIYVNGKLDGFYKLYDPDGDLELTTFVYNDVFHGESCSIKSTGVCYKLFIHGKERDVDVTKLTDEEKLYYTLKHGVKWL